MICGEGQKTSGYFSYLEKKSEDENNLYGVLNLTGLYDLTVAKTIERGGKIIEKKSVLIQDEYKRTTSCSIAWNMLTYENDNKRVMLTLNGQQMYADLLSNVDAEFSDISGERPYPEASNEGLRRLQVVIPVGSEPDISLAVHFRPVWLDGAVDPIESSTPLDEW